MTSAMKEKPPDNWKHLIDVRERQAEAAKEHDDPNNAAARARMIAKLDD